MVSVAKTWLMCGYYGLTILIIVFGFIVKINVNFRKGWLVLLSGLASP